MKAIKRNDELYRFMMYLDSNSNEGKLLIKELEKTREEVNNAINDKDVDKFETKGTAENKRIKKATLCLKLIALGYIHLAPVAENRTNDFFSITEEGWKFCESYERYIERRLTNRILTAIAILSAIYYLFEIIYSISGGQNCH
jgi:DNA-binding MarR family transcriptional regulator